MSQYRFNPFTKKLDQVDNVIGPPGTVTSLKGNDGVEVGPDGSGVINLVGAAGGGILVTGNPETNTETISLPGGGFTWVVQSTDFTAVKGFGYLITGAGVRQVQMPASPLVGDTFIVADIGGNFFKLNQNAGDSIQLGIDLTTVTTGSITSTKKGDTLMLVCWASGPGASWIALQPVGNFTVV